MSSGKYVKQVIMFMQILSQAPQKYKNWIPEKANVSNGN